MKTFARFYTAFGQSNVEIKDAQEAIDYGIDRRFKSFQTYQAYEASSVDKPQNISAMSYLGVDNILTAAQVAKLYDAAAKEATDPFWRELYENGRDVFKQYPAAAPYIDQDDVFGTGSGFTKIEAKDKVYNKQGNQIYPQQPAAPAVRARPSARPRL